MPEMLCARNGCAEKEDRIKGYCSVYCKDVEEYYDDGYRAGVKAAAKLAAAKESAGAAVIVHALRVLADKEAT